jgi:hypothetical protein
LQPSRRPGNGNGHPLGWWTKRLDVAMRDDSIDTDGELESLSQIIQSLPNLNILIFRVTNSEYQYVHLPWSFLHHLSRSAEPNLQAIVWYTRALTPDPHKLHAFLAGMPAIRTLSYADIHQSTENSLPALPALKTFCMPNNMRYSPNLGAASIPSLRHLIFGAYAGYDVGWKTLLFNHGQQLEVVRVHTILKSGVSDVLDTITQYCPKLHRLDIAVQTWGELNLSPDGLSLPASVRTFGVYCMQGQAPRTEYKQLFRALRNMKFGPAFKVIQFLHPNNVMDLCEHHRQLLLTNMPKLSELGFEVLDHEGQVLLFVSV